MSGRFLIDVTGPDAEDFLQGLVTNDVTRAAEGPVYAALLSPQGKYLADFFIVARQGGFVLDADAAQGPALMQRLAMYRLRAAVEIAPSDWTVRCGSGAAPAGAHPDPRDPRLGWRAWGPEGDLPQGDDADRDALRVALAVPAAGAELIPNETYILEVGFERLHGVDFRKGCYVGQEVTARMKHKTELKKGLVTLTVGAADPKAVPAGTPVLTADGREAGTVHTRAGGRALAHMRHDRIGSGLTADGVPVSVVPLADAAPFG